MKEQTLHRDESIDAVRLLAILSIIKTHSPLTTPLWDVYGFFLTAGAGVCFFFFMAALFCKHENWAICVRALWVFAAYIFWSVVLYLFLNPVFGALSVWLSSGEWTVSFPDAFTAPYEKIFLWDWTQVYPLVGHLWFFRLLLILTIASLFLIKLRSRWLIALGILFWCVRYTPLVSQPGYQEYLPFVFTEEWPSASVAAYCFGLVFNKCGGLRQFHKCCTTLFYPFVLLIVLRGAFLVYSMPESAGDILELMLPFALCSILHRLFQLRVCQSFNKFTCLLAPCIFSAYILHAGVNLVVWSASLHMPEEGLWFFKLLFPVVSFASCYVLYRGLRMVPRCSMLLCFVK